MPALLPVPDLYLGLLHSLLGCRDREFRRYKKNWSVFHDRGARTGANPTIAGYSASVAKIYNVTESIARFLE
jgi:hypothetical protein